jgi:hypothetical protein
VDEDERAIFGGGAGACRPEKERKLLGPMAPAAWLLAAWLLAAWLLAARRLDERTAAVAAVSLARSCEVSIGPAAVTASCRRTCATVETRLSTMPPGVQVCSFGTRRTARGSPRSGSGWAATSAATSAGAIRRAIPAPDTAPDTAPEGAPSAAGPATAGCPVSVPLAGGVHHRGGRTPASR